MKIKERLVNFGIIKINPTSNNIFVTLTDENGAVLISKHAGQLNFKGSKKKTPYVAGVLIKSLFSDIKKLNIQVKAYILEVIGFIKHPITNTLIRKLNTLKIYNIVYLRHYQMRTHGNIRCKKYRRL